MRRTFGLSLFLCLSLTACAVTVPFRITQIPEGRTPEQQSLDDLQCANASRVQGPLLFGIGYAIIRHMAAERYQACMHERGYVMTPT